MAPLVSLLFITIIPIACKITNFSLYLFVSFLKEITIITSWHAPNYKLVENPLASTLIFTHFQPLHSIINREQHEK